MTDKQKVINLLNRLSDDCSLENIQYHLYVLQKIEHGLKELDEGKGIPHEEVEKRMSKWLTA